MAIVALATCMLPTLARADQQPASETSVSTQSSDIASGSCGTSAWRITSDGTLVISAGTLSSIGSTASKSATPFVSTAPWMSYAKYIKTVSISSGVKAGAQACLFRGCPNLTSVSGLGYLDMSSVTDMSWMFGDCASLTSVDLTDMSASKVLDMSNVFAGDSSLKTVTFGSSFSSSQARNMSGMFSGCSALTSIDLANLVTTNVTDMSWMFAECSSLTSLAINSSSAQRFTTTRVTTMSEMFSACSSLSTLDISGLSTAAATSMTDMFLDCSSLSKVTVGSGFSFKGSGSAVLCTLPTPGAQKVSGATGNWGVVAGGSSQGVKSADEIAQGLSHVSATYAAETISGSQVVYRVFNPSTSEHLFTTDTNEVRVLVGSWGWTYEGSGWVAPAPSSETLPVFRLFQASTNQHLYTTDENEMRVLTTQYGWVYDNNGQPLFYSGGDIPIYRLFNVWSLQHHYTTSSNENSVLPTKGWGWQQEGWKLSCVSLGNSSYPYPNA